MLKIEAIGIIGKDAEVKNIGKGVYASFSVGVEKNNKKTGEKETQWLECLKYGENSGLLPYLKKGKRVFVEGGFNLNAYKNSKGEDKVGVSLFVDRLELLGGGGSETSKNSEESPQKQRKTGYAQKAEDDPFNDRKEEWDEPPF